MRRDLVDLVNRILAHWKSNGEQDFREVEVVFHGPASTRLEEDFQQFDYSMGIRGEELLGGLTLDDVCEVYRAIRVIPAEPDKSRIRITTNRPVTDLLQEIIDRCYFHPSELE